MREIGNDVDSSAQPLGGRLLGPNVFYVGGRVPSSTPAIRDLVACHGGEFLHPRRRLRGSKGLAGIRRAWAALVVFPVDCVDHDSADNLKRLCVRDGVIFVSLRGTSVANFAAALLELDAVRAAQADQAGCCGSEGPRS